MAGVLLLLALCQTGFALKASSKFSRNTGIAVNDASNFLDDVVEILDRPEMKDHIRLAAEGDEEEGQVVGMQFMPLGTKYGTDASKFISFDGKGLTWKEFCDLSEVEPKLRDKVKQVSSRWHEIVGSFDEAPRFSRKKMQSLVNDSKHFFEEDSIKKCVQLGASEEYKEAVQCWTTLTQPLLSKYNLKPYSVPHILPQMLLLGRDDASMRDEVLQFCEQWVDIASAMTEKKDEDKKEKKQSTGLSKAYAIAFIDDISKTMDKPEVIEEMEKFANGDPCAETVVNSYIKPICAKHRFQSGSGSIPPVFSLMKLGPEVKEKAFDVAVKWANMVVKDQDRPLDEEDANETTPASV